MPVALAPSSNAGALRDRGPPRARPVADHVGDHTVEQSRISENLSQRLVDLQRPQRRRAPRQPQVRDRHPSVRLNLGGPGDNPLITRFCRCPRLPSRTRSTPGLPSAPDPSPTTPRPRCADDVDCGVDLCGRGDGGRTRRPRLGRPGAAAGHVRGGAAALGSSGTREPAWTGMRMAVTIRSRSNGVGVGRGHTGAIRAAGGRGPSRKGGSNAGDNGPRAAGCAVLMVVG